MWGANASAVPQIVSHTDNAHVHCMRLGATYWEPHTGTDPLSRGVCCWCRRMSQTRHHRCSARV